MVIKQTKNNELGFTLVELLIVVLVIGVLSGIVLSVINVSGIRGKARDSQRIGDLKKIQTALELYFSDNAAYPISSSWVNLGSSAVLTTTLVSGGYINQIPNDPEGTTANVGPCSSPDNHRYNYRTTATGSEYVLTAIMDVVTSNDESACTSLSNWGTLGCSAGFATEDVCFGAENP